MFPVHLQVQLQDMEAPAERSIAISFLVGIALFFQFAFMIPSIVGRIVHEKDTGAKVDKCYCRASISKTCNRK